MNNKIILILPYFGTFSNYFQLFLNSCKYNQDIDFLIVTDNQEKFEYPKNVQVKYMLFEELKSRIQMLFDFEIRLDTYIKPCDYKPAYGEIFKDEIREYGFWGHCDCDLIFGHIRKFITDEILSKYEKIGHLGHLTIYKNTYENNRRYRLSIELGGLKRYPYKEVFGCSELKGFDEWNWPWFNDNRLSVNDIFKTYHIPVYYKTHFGDCVPFTDKFIETCYDPVNLQFSQTHVAAYHFANGKLFAERLGAKEERLYAHLQKRAISVQTDCEEEYFIIPNSFVSDFQGIRRITNQIKGLIDLPKRRIALLRLKGRIIRTIKKTLNLKKH